MQGLTGSHRTHPHRTHPLKAVQEPLSLPFCAGDGAPAPIDSRGIVIGRLGQTIAIPGDPGDLTQ